MEIKRLFDPAKDIYRTIEKVITYQAAQEERLKAEITEYVVTEHIEEQLESLLTKMEMALGDRGTNEIGVWVSGFYGSGKSSFTKYLGLALDQSVTIEGIPFLRYLQDRLHKPQTKALLNTVATRYPSAVIMLDLAADMIAGATMEEVSTVLYYKVLQWAGYAQNLKVAALERKLKQDGRYSEFTDAIEAAVGSPWKDVQNDSLVIDSLLPELAHTLYPTIFKTPAAFTTETSAIIRFETARVQEMIDIVREVSGKEQIIFIIDEVGQYVGPRPQLILNLDGLAKNLKELGQGRVWIIGTAQQTLTEDDPRAALNSPELYKLAARFPIQMDLESSDIKEICYRRLLGKSTEGATVLAALYEQHGQALRHYTKLQDARYYSPEIERDSFVNLYPFLPAHFDILLYLLGKLAKSTSGIGLRSAIKVIQDILVERGEGQIPMADRPVGWLATTVTLYDALERDIRRAEPSIYKAVSDTLQILRNQPLHQQIAKSVAILQILGNLPITPANVIALLHPQLDAADQSQAVNAAIRDLISAVDVPFGEKEGELCFFSEKLNTIDRERSEIIPRSIETRRLQNDALRELFQPLPTVRLHNSLSVSAGLKAVSAGQAVSLAGEREIIQLITELVDSTEYATARSRLLDESRQRNTERTLFLLGRIPPEIAELVSDVYRCREIVQRYRTDPDQEVKEYCAGQTARGEKLMAEVQRLLRHNLSQGSFLFRGQLTAVDSLDSDFTQATRKELESVAAQVFDRYAEASWRAETDLAERFLRLNNLNAVTTATDPLGLVQIRGGTPRIDTTHKAIVSLRDFINRSGQVEGKRLIDTFSDAPFGWSPDTLRYLAAALLVGGELTLRVAGRDITVNGQQALDALRTNQAFRNVGVSLRSDTPDIETLARAAERLTRLTGEAVIPLEDEISKTSARYFATLQQRYGSLANRLTTLELSGAENAEDLSRELAEILQTDASDAARRLGSQDAPLFYALEWANQAHTALAQGLEQTVRQLQRYRREIAALPATGIPGDLQQQVAPELAQLSDWLTTPSFYQHRADLASLLTRIESATRSAAAAMAAAQQQSIQEAQQQLQQLPDWSILSRDQQNQILGQVEHLALEAPASLAGFQQLLTQEYVIQSTTRTLKQRVERLAQEISALDIELPPKIATKFNVPARLQTPADLDALITELQGLRNKLALNEEIVLVVKA